MNQNEYMYVQEELLNQLKCFPPDAENVTKLKGRSPKKKPKRIGKGLLSKCALNIIISICRYEYLLSGRFLFRFSLIFFFLYSLTRIAYNVCKRTVNN